MPDLKPFYDAVIAAEEEVQRIANQIHEHFVSGTDEGKINALKLRFALDEAQKKHDDAVALYDAMQRANRPNDIAKNFIPVSSAEQVDNQPTVIKRQEYDRMSLVARARFIRTGGKIED